VSTTSNPYDDFIYPTYAFPQTHPDLLGVLANLFGLQAAPSNRCRMLEMGCGTGGNLIPLAAALPESQFVGVDYSGKQIETARERVKALGLKNLEFHHASVTDIDPSWGQFDFAVCHGVYSWVPEEVQDAILRVCRENLQPHGIGYISYNTLPGWHLRGMVREMMCYHDTWHRNKSPQERVQQARALLKFLAEATAAQQTPYSVQLKRELETLAQLPDSYIYHEHLEEYNAPVYFFEFEQRLRDRKLRFLGESHFPSMIHQNLPENVRQGLQAVAPDLIQMEQYLDFVNNRTFRQSLICHIEQKPDYNVTPDRLVGMLFQSPLKPQPPEQGNGFVLPNGQILNTDQPVTRAVLLALAEIWPGAAGLDELQRRTRYTTGEVAAALLGLYAAAGQGVVRIWKHLPAYAHRPSERPEVWSVVRRLAHEGAQVPSLRHETNNLEPLDRQLIHLLDGKRSRAQVRDLLLEAHRKGEMNVNRDGKRVEDEHQARAVLNELIDQKLKRYAEAALLVA
jgi:methyltransferase-like protein/SAM-dependent methyltransferase